MKLKEPLASAFFFTRIVSCAAAFVSSSSTSFLNTHHTQHTTCPLPSPFPAQQQDKTALNALAINSAQEGDWRAYIDDEKTGLIFYFNHKTQESRWEAPSSSFPSIQLNDFLLEKVRDLRREYKSTLQKSQTTIWRFENPLDKKQVTTIKEVNTMEKDLVNGASTKKDKGFNLSNTFGEWTKSFNGGGNKNDDEDDDSQDVPVASKSTPVSKVVSSTKREDKFTFAQKIESTKAAVIGGITGAVTMLPFNLVEEASNYNLNPFQFLFDEGTAGLEAALFAIVYRYCVRDGEESNEQLGQGVWGAFALTRALTASKGMEVLSPDMIAQSLVGGVESFVLFGAAKFAMDMAVEKGFVNRMD
jgi:hypothetical protein